MKKKEETKKINTVSKAKARAWKVCLYCGKKYVPVIYNQKYCCLGKYGGHKARDRKRKMETLERKLNTPCAYCNEKLEADSGTVYCNGNCRVLFYKNKEKISGKRKCVFCLKLFERSNRHRKFCSSLCRTKSTYKEYGYRRYSKRINSWISLRRKSDTLFRIRLQMSDRIRKSLKRERHIKNKHLDEILGCSVSSLKGWLEGQFKDDMNWSNYGSKGWHIDHIIPLHSAKSRDDIYKLWHFSNLQPLWWQENLKKGTSL